MHLEMVPYSSTTEIIMKGLTEMDRIDIIKNGIRPYMFCMGIEKEITSLLNTINLFTEMPEAFKVDPKHEFREDKTVVAKNIEFLKEYMNFEYEVRDTVSIDLDINLYESGDVIMFDSLYGLGSIIKVGTGSRATHCMMVLDFDGKKWMVESTGTGV
jgi:hypothetical protein